MKVLKHSLAAISPLRYMVCHTGDDDPAKSRHRVTVGLFAMSVNGKASP